MTVLQCLRLAGLGQIGLAAASTTIPFLLDWRAETARLRPLLRQLFCVYAAYILGCNLAFGLLSLLAPESLVDGSFLAAAVTGFIAAYWVGRLGVQVFFDRSDIPRGTGYRLAEAALVSLFSYLAATYATVFAVNLR